MNWSRGISLLLLFSFGIFNFAHAAPKFSDMKSPFCVSQVEAEAEEGTSGQTPELNGWDSGRPVTLAPLNWFQNKSINNFELKKVKSHLILKNPVFGGVLSGISPPKIS